MQPETRGVGVEEFWALLGGERLLGRLLFEERMCHLCRVGEK